MYKAVVGGWCALLLGAAPVLSATIDVGTFLLEPDKPGQEIQIWVQPDDPDNPEQIAGMDLFAQIADGGPDIGIPGSHIDGPEFTGADMQVGTIFEPDPVSTPVEILDGGQVLVGGIILGTEGSTVDANGLLVTLTIDTTGFFSDDPNNPWELKLTDTLDPAGTALLDNSVPRPQPIPVTIINGWIEIVPEPSAVTMLLGVLAGMGLLVCTGRLRRPL